ncbi:MAG TPA: hypothetical protein VEF36_14430 [Roseiarcus sp.]|nr:hypothetical protein [Roseiarcus sp.]
MANNFQKYEKDISLLVRRGGLLAVAMQREIDPNAKIAGDITPEELLNLPDPRSKYEAWFSEALAIVSQLLPERVEDFRSYYQPKHNRKEILHSNYTMYDYLRSTSRHNAYGEQIVGPSSGLHAMYQQFNIIQGLSNRFKSTLFDIRTLVHADILDDELQAAEELNSKGFQRGAGAIAGVVLEGHLAAVCERHSVTPKKKTVTISELNETLKAASVIDTAVWRFIQHLGDLRNKCDHKKTEEPMKAEVGELIDGVRKITKTVF